MLIIPTFTAIHNNVICLFSTIYLQPNQCIATWMEGIDVTLIKPDIESLPFYTKMHLISHGYRQGETYRIPLDNLRFMRHSETPNIVHIDDSDYTVKAIPANTELTCDYRTFNENLMQFKFKLNSDHQVAV